MDFLKNIDFMGLIDMLAPYLSYIIMGLIVLLVLKLLHFKAKTIIKILINIVVGGIVLFCINMIPGINVSIDIWKSLAVGIFGVPAVVIILVLHFFF